LDPPGGVHMRTLSHFPMKTLAFVQRERKTAMGCKGKGKKGRGR
jgi:hypothetical protein